MNFKNYTLMFFIFLFIFSCNKRAVPPDVPDRVIYIENFRKPGMTDQMTIQTAIDSVPDSSTLVFKDRIYNIDHTISVKKSLSFKGPATLKREDQIQYSLVSATNSDSRQIELNSTEGLRIKDWIIITNGNKEDNSATQRNMITAIEGNYVTLFYPLGKFKDGVSDFVPGNLLFKDIRFFEIDGMQPGIFPTQSCTFEDIIFDGNRDNNRGTYSWLLNYSVMASSKGKTIISGCQFINSPGETVVGHNLYISNSLFQDLNGSAIHTSIDRLHVAEKDIHSQFENNHFENTNEIPTKITGHSEGCITHSNSGGYYTAKNNSFINVGEAVLGLLYPSVSVNDWGTSNIIFEKNTINTSGRLIYAIGLLDGRLENVRIVDNEIHRLSPWDWSLAKEHYPDILIENQVNQ